METRRVAVDRQDSNENFSDRVEVCPPAAMLKASLNPL